MTVLDDDANRLLDGQGIPLQCSISVNRAEQPDPQLVVHAGSRQHFYLVVNPLNAFNALHHVPCSALQNRPRDLSHQRDVVALHFIHDVVKYVVVGKQQDLVADFSADSFLGTSGNSSLGKQRERSCEDRNEKGYSKKPTHIMPPSHEKSVRPCVYTEAWSTTTRSDEPTPDSLF